MAIEACADDEHQSKRRKLSRLDLYKDVLGSPKLVVAPMVDQSELPWRILSRRYGAQLVYTPMINARMFAERKHKNYKEQAFDMIHGEEGGPSDRPLIVQFAANDPEWLLEAAKLVEPYCDAVDINFGCPQDIARRGHYGCYLQDDWDLVYRLINNLHENLSIPVTAKFRVFPSTEKTVEYAKMMERAGAQILTCHGRTREQKGHKTGLANWEKIRAVKKAVSVPVFANGNILFHDDIQRCLDATGADGVMTAEGNLYNPTVLFNKGSASKFGASKPHTSPTSASCSRHQSEFFSLPEGSGVYLPSTALALEYLEIVRALKTTVNGSAIKGHLFKLLRPSLGLFTDLRASLGRIGGKRTKDELLNEFTLIVKEVERRSEEEMKQARGYGNSLEELIRKDERTGLQILPHWLAQPYFRPPQANASMEAAQTTEANTRVASHTILATEASPTETGVEGLVEEALQSEEVAA